MDYTTITAAVDWSAVTTGIGAVAALLAVVLAAKTGARKILSFIGR